MEFELPPGPVSPVASRRSAAGNEGEEDNEPRDDVPHLPSREDPELHPHDLRHRRITVWHQSGVPARELAERAGHSKPSMSLDVYSHVMPVAEVAEERLVGALSAD